MDEWRNIVRSLISFEMRPLQLLNSQKTVPVSDGFNWKSITQSNAIQLYESVLLSGMEGK
jgi:hypothetical protein